MKSWSETLQLPKPLRGAALRTANPDGAPNGENGLPPEAEASYRRGLVDGEKVLSQQLLEQRAEMHALISGVIESLRKTPAQVIRETENTMVALALTVAQKLVGDMPISVPMIELAVRDALQQMEGSTQFTVRLNSADLELLQKAQSPVLGSEQGKDFRFVASPDVSRGGCVVETNFGTVDARRETKIELVRRSLAA